MCGFIGIVTKDNKVLEEYQTSLEYRLNLISHRGPEGSQVKVGNDYAVGHAILSIQGSKIIQNQPISNSRYLMLYNGEIFNNKFAKSITKEYINEYSLDDSDTPILFNGLINEGITYLKNIDGFYSIFFYDKYEQKGWLVRDPSGQKPLYYELNHNSLLFSSEIKGISSSDKSINKEALETFKAIGYIPSPKTIYKNINSVRPGELIYFSIPDNITEKISTKHSRIFQIDKIKKITKDLPINLKNLISNKVKLNTIGSRDIAVLLSGGLDSSIILNEASKHTNIQAYTAKYKLPLHKQKKYNIDYFYAKRLCQVKDIPLNTVTIDFDNKEKLLNAIDEALYFLDQPHYIGTLLAKFEIANEISKRHPNIKIVLSGDGSDELFLGYRRYQLQKFLNLIISIPLSRKILKLISKFEFLLNNKYLKYFLNLDDKNFSHIATWTEMDFIKKKKHFKNNLSNRIFLLKKVFKENAKDIKCNYLKKFYGIKDLWSWIPDDSNMLNDRSFSHKGIECRSPFITSKLYDDLIPHFNYESVPNKSKKILHDAFSSDFEPNFFDRTKWGWTSPVHFWIEILGNETLDKALNSSFIKKYFPEIKDSRECLNWSEKWKIILCWRWSLVNNI